ncbi:MAG TPA: hypothetical protein VIL65_00650 [Beijerinckiaceae bacterium]|jgi:hypothetical protein
MTLLRTALLILLGCTGAAVVAMAALIMSQPRPMFDRAHPEYATFAARFAEAQRAFAAGEDWAVIDLAPVKGGAWRTACLFGGYTRPVERLEALGAVVSQADRQRLGKAIGWRVSPVEEFEMLIAFSDEQGRAHFIHFDQGMGAEGQHYEACVTRPKTKVAVAPWHTEPPGTPPPLLD